MKKFKIALSIGDPAGIGPEITAKLLLNKKFCSKYPFITIGPRFILDDAFKNILKVEPPDYKSAYYSDIKPFNFSYGKNSQDCGEISMKAVEYAVKGIQKGEFDALVTCPINKHSTALAGYPYNGHTDFLAYLTGAKSYTMMLASKKLKVALVTTHIPIREVAGKINEDNILKTIANVHNSAKFFGVKDKPSIAVAALNPHAGDMGEIGSEEIEIICPALQKALEQGYNVSGPHAPDALFAFKDKYDFVVAMYHDQGLIPLKMEDFGRAVNITLNLPIIRTSVDHGTAFDIAGKGIASTASLEEAVKMAYHMAESR